MFNTFTAVLLDERGQALAEYALILGLVAVLCVGALRFLGHQIQGVLGDVSNSLVGDGGHGGGGDHGGH